MIDAGPSLPWRRRSLTIVAAATVLRYAAPVRNAGSIFYAPALLIAGVAGLWRVSLSTDEAWYYDRAIRFFAAHLPRVPLDYSAPSPPLGFVLQAIVFRLTGGSVATVRAISTVAAIATVFLIADALKEHARGSLVALMIGTFPPMLVYAFSLKQHWLTIFFLVSGYLLRERGRDAWASVLFLFAVLTNQIAAAFVLAILIRQFVLRRRFFPYVLPLAALGALVLWWRGLQPPMYQGPGDVPQPGLLHLFWPQVLLLLAMAGIWIVPMIGGQWRRIGLAAATTPVAAVALRYSGIMTVDPHSNLAFYKSATGPMLGLLRMAAGTGWLSIIVAAVAIAIGGALFVLKGGEDIAHAQLYAATYALVMLPVPFFFESYYAVLVIGSWTILGRHMASSRSRLALTANAAAIIAGAGYSVFRFMFPS